MRYFVWSEASGMQQVLINCNSKDAAEEASKGCNGIALAEDELNEDERKVIADLDEQGQWDSYGRVMLDTADEGDLAWAANLLGVKSTHEGWQELLDTYASEGADSTWYAIAEDMQDSEEDYAAMLAINSEIAKRVRFVALGSYGKTHG